MHRLLRHIALMSLALLWAVSVGGAPAPVASAAADHAGAAQQQVGQLAQQNEDLSWLIMQSLSSDNAPSSYALSGGRVLLPVVRLNPYHKLTFGTAARMPEPAPLYAQQNAVQQRSVARFRAALDESGYYVFALRKIII